MAILRTRRALPDYNATCLDVVYDTAADALTVNTQEAQSVKRIEVAPATDLTTTAQPTIEAGYDGQVCNLVNISTTKSYTIQDNRTLSGTLLSLLAAKVTLGPGQGIVLVYSAAFAAWIQLSGRPAFLQVALPSAVGVTLSALQSIADTLLRTGAAAGVLIDTTATGPNIIAALAHIPYDGTFVKRIRFVNTVGFQITYTPNATGVTVNGTATIANNTWRDFDLQVATNTTVVYTNVGAGTV